MFTPRFKAGQRVDVKVFKNKKGKLCILQMDSSFSQMQYQEASRRSGLVKITTKIVPEDFGKDHFDSSDNTYRLVPVSDLYQTDELSLVIDSHVNFFWAHDSFLEDCCGMSCAECHNGFPYAEPNFGQIQLVCWSCVDGMGWKYKRESGKITLK